MHILLVSPVFAPDNKIAAHRATAFALDWHALGAKVTVLTKKSVIGGFDRPIPSDIRMIRFSDPVWEMAEKRGAESSTAMPNIPKRGRLSLSDLARMVFWPDRHNMWAALASVGLVFEKSPKPDVVVVTVGPFSSLLLGAWASKLYRVPLVVDYRDHLSLSHYNQSGRLRRYVEARIEKSLVGRALLVTAVSETMSGELFAFHGRPTRTIRNGFVAEDFMAASPQPSGSAVSIGYFGTIYPQDRDPRALFEALKLLEHRGGKVPNIRVEFYGPSSPYLASLVRECGVEHFVSLRGVVSHEESVQLQSSSDLLLLLLRNHPREKGVLTGKLFEYIGSGRPILSVGLERGEASSLINDHGLGLSSSNPERIADFLMRLAKEKSETGKVAGPDSSIREHFLRSTQNKVFFDALETALFESGAVLEAVNTKA